MSEQVPSQPPHNLLLLVSPNSVHGDLKLAVPLAPNSRIFLDSTSHMHGTQFITSQVSSTFNVLPESHHFLTSPLAASLLTPPLVCGKSEGLVPLKCK